MAAGEEGVTPVVTDVRYDGAAGVEEATFLVQSLHRIELLRALRDGSRMRGALTERVDISRVTVGRWLGETVVAA